MDEVFGAENFCGFIAFAKKTSATSELIPDQYRLCYFGIERDLQRVKYRQISLQKLLMGAATQVRTQ